MMEPKEEEEESKKAKEDKDINDMSGSENNSSDDPNLQDDFLINRIPRYEIMDQTSMMEVIIYNFFLVLFMILYDVIIKF